MPELHRDIEHTVRGWPGIARLGAFATLQIGPDAVLATLGRDFEDRLGCAHVERTVGDIERELKGRDSRIARLFVEAQSLERRNNTWPRRAPSTMLKPWPRFASLPG